MAAGNGLRGRRRWLSAVLLWAAAVGTTGCDGGNYMEVCDLPDEGWQGRQAIVFTFRPDSATVRRAATRDRDDGQWIDLMVRHRNDFPYADLPLEIKGVAPDKRFWVDTVDIPLARPDADGAAGQYRWTGRAYSNHRDITLRYRSGIRYGAFGEYALSIRQLVTADTLHGILAVGVIVSRATAAQPLY